MNNGNPTFLSSSQKYREIYKGVIISNAMELALLTEQ